jgi:hexosaminidase
MEFVRTLWKDLVPLFPGAEVFIGGDEAHTTCWASNKAVAAWAEKLGLAIANGTEATGGEGSLFGWYIDKVVSTVHGELGKRPAMWSPLHWDPAAPPAKLVSAKALLNLWTGDLSALAYNITKSGTNELVTSVGWYLPTGNAYKVDPKAYCTNDTASKYRCTAAQRERIVGGEACMWGEGIDLSNFFTSVWPVRWSEDRPVIHSLVE